MSGFSEKRTLEEECGIWFVGKKDPEGGAWCLEFSVETRNIELEGPPETKIRWPVFGLKIEFMGTNGGAQYAEFREEAS